MTEANGPNHKAGVILFKDDADGYLRWLAIQIPPAPPDRGLGLEPVVGAGDRARFPHAGHVVAEPACGLLDPPLTWGWTRDRHGRTLDAAPADVFDRVEQ